MLQCSAMRHSRSISSMFLGALSISCFKNTVHLGRRFFGITQHKSFLALHTCMGGIQCIGIQQSLPSSIYKIWLSFTLLQNCMSVLVSLLIIMKVYFSDRDIKGANILVDPNGDIKLADFGMAKHVSAKLCQSSHNSVVNCLPFLSF